MGRARKALKIVLGVAACLAAVPLLVAAFNDDSLTTVSYSVTSSKLKNHYSIVQITDYHNHSLSYKNEGILEAIDEAFAGKENPIIVVTGDTVDDHTKESDYENLGTMFSHFQEKGYKVYEIDGNHEAALRSDEARDRFHALLESYGVVCLDGTEENGYLGSTYSIADDLTISGISDPAHFESGYHPFQEDYGNVDEQLSNLDKSVGEGTFNIVLCHRPALFERIKNHDAYDLTYSGHYHGGQVRIFGWPVFATPNSMGRPSYVVGFHSEGDGQSIIVGSGAGVSYHYPIRVNCSASITVTDLIPE
jgi:predicted MPP superfamily phosphohydrolase